MKRLHKMQLKTTRKERDAIRAKYKKVGVKMQDIAEEYGLCKNTIWQIIKNPARYGDE